MLTSTQTLANVLGTTHLSCSLSEFFSLALSDRSDLPFAIHKQLFQNEEFFPSAWERQGTASGTLLTKTVNMTAPSSFYFGPKKLNFSQQWSCLNAPSRYILFENVTQIVGSIVSDCFDVKTQIRADRSDDGVDVLISYDTNFQRFTIFQTFIESWVQNTVKEYFNLWLKLIKERVTFLRASVEKTPRSVKKLKGLSLLVPETQPVPLRSQGSCMKGVVARVPLQRPLSTSDISSIRASPSNTPTNITPSVTPPPTRPSTPPPPTQNSMFFNWTRMAAIMTAPAPWFDAIASMLTSPFSISTADTTLQKTFSIVSHNWIQPVATHFKEAVNALPLLHKQRESHPTSGNASSESIKTTSFFSVHSLSVYVASGTIIVMTAVYFLLDRRELRTTVEA